MSYDIADFLRASGATQRSLDAYEAQLRQVSGWIGDKPLGEVTTRDVDSIKRKLRTMASGPQYAALLRSFYGKAKKAARRDGDESAERRYEGIHDDLFLKQRVKRLSPQDILTPREVEAMVQACASGRDKALIACLWETGVRVHELLAVNLGDVRETDSPENGGRKMYLIWFRKVKVAGEEHQGYIIEGEPLLRAWLRAHPDPRADAPLFTTYEGKRLGNDGALHVVKERAKRAGIQKRVYNHLFRHSRTTFLLANGMSEARVKALLGWKAGSVMLARYAHLVSGDAKAGLFEMYGMRPEKVEVQRLNFNDEAMKPVVPMVAGPHRQSEAIVKTAEKLAVTPEGRQLVATALQVFVEMAKDPAALKAFVAALEHKDEE